MADVKAECPKCDLLTFEGFFEAVKEMMFKRA